MRQLKFRLWEQNKRQMTLVASISFGDDGSALTIMPQPAPKGQYFRELVHGENCVLMQYTGINDKNGKEVYEGDIVKAVVSDDNGSKVRGVVKEVIINEGFLAPFYMRVNFEEDWWKDSLVDGFEIVGNIYEHPGLLKEG